MPVLAHRGVDEANGLLADQLRCVDDLSALQVAVAAEHIRAAVYASSIRTETNGIIQPVHTTRLLNEVRRTLNFIWPGLNNPMAGEHGLTTHKVARATLDRMATLGDVADIGGGFWLATPPRLIGASSEGSLLVIGGVPAQVVHSLFGAAPLSAGASRFVPAAKPIEQMSVHPVDAWLGHAPSLSSWTAEVLAAYRSRMAKLDELPPDQLEVYAPDILRDQRRTGRWINAGQIGKPLQDIRLCRVQERYARSWRRPDYLVTFHFKGGALSLNSAAPIGHDLTLRLRFGLDERLKTPRTFAVFLEGDTFVIDRPPQLPEPECRVLSLGWDADLSTKPAAERLRFHQAALPIVLHALGRVAVQATVMERRRT